MRRIPILATAILFLAGAAGAADDGSGQAPKFRRDYRGDMRAFVQAISADARALAPGFIVVPQNGLELMTREGWPGSGPVESYVAAIDGVSQESVFHGMTGYDVPTPADQRDWIVGLLDFAKQQGLSVLVANYADSRENILQAFAEATAHGYIVFSAFGEDYLLDNIPPYPASPFAANADDVERLAQARNFLYLINPQRFATKADFLAAVGATDYDLVIMDAYHDQGAWTAAEVAQLQTKANGGRRLVISYMNIGLAEDFRSYWQPGWGLGNPDWIVADYDSEYFSGEYHVNFWDPEWQGLFYGSPDSYIRRIVGAGFDGVYLDNVEAYYYFEQRDSGGQEE